MRDALADLLRAAQAHRDQGRWDEAIRLFNRAAQEAPQAASIRHNLAICSFAKGDAASAKAHAAEAIRRDSALWQSQALLARILQGQGESQAAHAAWEGVLRSSPDNPAALIGLADLDMNAFGDPSAAAARVAPLRIAGSHAADAELTTLMAALYTGEIAPAALSARLAAFSKAQLRLSPMAPRALRTGRRRIGLISPLLSASPVYYLTYSTFAAMAEHHDLVLFNRGARQDEATERFRDLSTEWIDVREFAAEPLAGRLQAAELDILFDLGGWSDAVALKALSAKPAARMYSWVGGQSATTGLPMFDGWIGDEWQSPSSLASFYAEPLVPMPGGYVDYTPPLGLGSLAARPKAGAALVGNPAKIGPGTIQSWPAGVGSVSLIDRRYRHERTLLRVTELLGTAGIKIDRAIVPDSHANYLRALAGFQAMVNTQPYAAGLTAVEAHHLGVRLLSASNPGPLFCQRHHLSHLRTGGTNRQLAGAMLQLVSE